MNEEKNAQAKLYYLYDNVIESVKNKFIALDFETTGLSSQTERIVEIGAVLYENGTITKTFNELVNPNHPISAEARRVNGITEDMMANAPSEQEIYPKFIEFLNDALDGNTYIVAHNARFEAGFITETFNRLGYKANFKFLDTLYLSKNLVPGLKDYHQATVAQHFNIINPHAHRAVTDATTCGNILLELIKIAEINNKK